MSTVADLFFVDDIKIVNQVAPTPIAKSSGTKGPGELFDTGDLITGGEYTLDFFNDSGTELVAAGFVISGEADNTWIFAQAHKDYLITSTAGDYTIKAYARQIPGPTDPATREQVFLESWREP